MKMHMEVWEHYGKNFFELFDLHTTRICGSAIVTFYKEIHDIEVRSSIIKPPEEKKCAKRLFRKFLYQSKLQVMPSPPRKRSIGYRSSMQKQYIWQI